MQLSGKCGPVKYKYLTTKFLKFMSKKMSKVIMLRTKLLNEFLKKKDVRC